MSRAEASIPGGAGYCAVICLLVREGAKGDFFNKPEEMGQF